MLALTKLNSYLKKFGENPHLLKMYDQVIPEQGDLGIIEKIENIDEFWPKTRSVVFSLTTAVSSWIQRRHNAALSFCPIYLRNATTSCRIRLENLQQQGSM